MLRFERQVVACLTTSGDDARRAEVERFVAASLGAMPEHLRLGVVTLSVALGAWARVGSRPADVVVEGLRTSPIGLLRQYERLLGSLVLFAEQELSASPAPAPAPAR